MTRPSLLDIEAAQRIEGCTFDDAFRRRLDQAASDRTAVDNAISAEIEAARVSDLANPARPKSRWQRLRGTPPYEDPRFRVLRNRPGLTSPVTVDRLTARTCALRMTEVFSEPLTLSSRGDLLALHGQLFGDIFGWAGQMRFVNLSREGIDFAPVPALDLHLDLSVDLLRSCTAQRADHGAVRLETFCSFLAEFLWCHPFRDGNGRTAMAVVMSLTAPGALSTVTRKEWYTASAASLQVAGFPDPEPWAPLVHRMLEH